MISIVNTGDITGIELDPDWTVLDYDTGTEESSGLASIQYSTVKPPFSIQELTLEEYEVFKQSSVWRIA